MRSRTRLAVAAIALGVVIGVAGESAQAQPVQWPLRRAQTYNWHANYAHYQYGQPVALVVPPNAQLQTDYGWGVSNSRLSRLDHQFGRNYPGVGPFGGPFRSTPVWPQDTRQFGVYHVRGPW